MHMRAHMAIYWLECMYMYSCLCMCVCVEWGWREAEFFVNTEAALGRDYMLISPSLSSSLPPFFSFSLSSSQRRREEEIIEYHLGEVPGCGLGLSINSPGENYVCLGKKE